MMNITIRNKAKVSGKHERKVKWLIYNLYEKFKDILYTKVFFNKEGSTHPTYSVNLVVGLPGNDLVIKNTGTELTRLIMDVYNAAKRHLSRRKRDN